MSESVAIPIHILPDGREFIADRDCEDRPEVGAFVKRFNNYWCRAEFNLDGWVGPTPEEREEVYKNG